MADAAAAVQGEPERAGDGIHLYPAQHQRHAAGVRARQGEGRTVQGHHQGKSGALSSEAESTAQIRLLDPQVVSPTFKQLQQSKQYYTFADTLAVDKYDIDGVSQDTVIAARELDLEATTTATGSTTTLCIRMGTVSWPHTATRWRRTGSRSSSNPASPPRASSPNRRSTSRASTSPRTPPNTRLSGLRRAWIRGSSTIRPDRRARPIRLTAMAAPRWATSSRGFCTRSGSDPIRSCSPTVSPPTRRSCTTVPPRSASPRSPRT